MATEAEVLVSLRELIGKVTAAMNRSWISSDKFENVYKDIPDLVNRIDDLRIEALDKDQKEYDDSWSWFLETFSFLGNPVKYYLEKEEYDGKVRKCKEFSEIAIANLREVCKTAEEFLDVPERLNADAKIWKDIAAEADALSREIPELARVEGWSGPAAEQYAIMTGVQAEACVEYRERAKVIKENIEAASELNRAVLVSVRGFLQNTLNNVKADINSLVTDRYYYHRRTGSISQRLVDLGSAIKACYRMSDAPARDVMEKYRVSQDGAVLTKQASWPSGTAQAGVAAGDTSASGVDIGKPKGVSMADNQFGQGIKKG